MCNQLPCASNQRQLLLIVSAATLCRQKPNHILTLHGFHQTPRLGAATQGMWFLDLLYAFTCNKHVQRVRSGQVTSRSKSWGWKPKKCVIDPPALCIVHPHALWTHLRMCSTSCSRVTQLVFQGSESTWTDKFINGGKSTAAEMHLWRTQWYYQMMGRIKLLKYILSHQ